MTLKSLAALAALLAAWPTSSIGADGDESPPTATPAEVFEQRIMPIFRSPQPASCVQCHLSSVDLKDYILPSHEQTFASLRDQGLIDLAQPAESKILQLIRMGDSDPDEGARLIHETTRQAEYEAFAAWVAACCNDPALRDLPRLPAESQARPDRSDEVIRHTRKDRVIDSFARNVWSQRMRCFPCHTPHELDESNPQHRVAIERHKKFLEQYGEDFGERMNLFRETPEATVASMIEKSRNVRPGELPILNLADPARSLLLLKPTSKLPPKTAEGEFEDPSYADPVSHMGGLKMHVDDQSYKSFIAWIQDYARVVGEEYKSVDELPRDDWYASKLVLMIREAPEAWPVGARMQVFVHAWDSSSAAWSAEPVAFTQGQAIRNVGGPLFLFGSALRDEAAPLDRDDPRLAPGKYLLKACLDTHNRLAADPTLLLPADDLVGQVEIDARWEPGFPQAEKVLGPLLK
jgi:hypothetical protein